MIRKFMKKYFLLLLCLSALLVSCTGRSNGWEDFSDSDSDKIETFVLSDLSEYNILSSDLSSATEKEALVYLRTAIEKGLGIKLNTTTDWLDENHKESEKEILIGETNRKESVSSLKGLGNSDFVVKMVGSKLVILGGSDKATMAAVQYVVDNCIDVFRTTLNIPSGKGYKYTQTFLFNKLTIGGNDISEYKLYSANPERDLTDIAEYLGTSVVDNIFSVADEIYKDYKYIIFDDAHTIARQYGVTFTSDSNLYVYGSYSTYETAVDFFCHDYLEGLSEKSREYDISVTDNRVLVQFQEDIYTKQELLEVLGKVYDDDSCVIIGEQCGGSQTMPGYTLSSFKDKNGTYPAMLGIDLSCYGLQLTEMTDSDRSRVICELVDFASKGGIITASAHFENPTGNWTSKGKCRGLLGGEDAWGELMKEGSFLNETFKKELYAVSLFLKALDNNKVPVLFRPLNETNGSEFWYCARQGKETVSRETVQSLWKYVYNYFSEFEIENLLWVYSAELSGTENEALSVVYGYPGAQYADLVGGAYETDGKNVLGGDKYSALISETGKIGGITELSLAAKLISQTSEGQSEKYSSLDLLSSIKSSMAKGNKYAYIVTWSGTNSVGWLGQGRAMFEDGFVLDLYDVKALFDSLK